MVAMSSTVTLKGTVKFSVKKMFTGSEMTKSTFTGPGEVLLAPPALGDIVPIRLDGRQTWSLGKDGLLGHTNGVKIDTKAQGLGKAMFSGEGLFVYTVSGQGVLFITSLGAIIQKNVSTSLSSVSIMDLEFRVNICVIVDGRWRKIYCRQ